MKLLRLFHRAIWLVGLVCLPGLTGLSRAEAQAVPPAGTAAFVGVDDQGSASVYVLDLASGRVGRVDTLVSADAHLAWQPGDGGMLAFPLQDGGYGLLRSLRGCFDGEALCEDLIEVYPAFVVESLAWSPDGTALFLQTEGGLKLSPPRGRPSEIRDLQPVCDQGMAVSNTPLFLFCASAEASADVHTAVYSGSAADFTVRYDIGTYPQITAFDVGPDGRSVVGTLEAGGDSGFYTPAAGGPARLANYQVHVYDLEFRPDGSQIAVAGATSDATGDGTLRDGDPAELFLYDTGTGVLAQTPGFTEATALTWSPDGQNLLVITGQRNFSVYSLASGQIAPVSATLPQVKVLSPAWSPLQASLPAVPTATPVLPPTAVPTPTPAATLTPFPTALPFPTLTPFPTFTAIPSATPGSPMGNGCEYVYAGNGGLPPVTIGDTAEVTRYGAAIRFRSGAALTAPMIQELAPGTRMTIQNGPYCSQGYRWWQVQLADGRVGFLADSDPGGYWINKVALPPTVPPESINFYADRYSITLGQCVSIRWDVEGIKAVYYQGAGVTGHEARTECPTTSTTYTLRVIRLDNTEVLRQITVIVS